MLFFVDADVELVPDTVERVAEILCQRPELAAVIGSYDEAPAHPSWVSRYRNLLHHYVHQHGRVEASTFWGGSGAIRGEVFAALGGFDEGFAEPSIEDIDLGVRLRRAGHRIELIKQLQVKHLKRWTVLDMLHTALWRRAVPWTELMLRDGELLNDLNVKTSDRWSVAAVGVLTACLVVAFFWPPVLLLSLAAAVVVWACHAPLYRFFSRQGLRFAAVAVFWHVVYLFVCGLGYGLGWLRFLRRGRIDG